MILKLLVSKVILAYDDNKKMFTIERILAKFEAFKRNSSEKSSSVTDYSVFVCEEGIFSNSNIIYYI